MIELKEGAAVFPVMKERIRFTEAGKQRNDLHPEGGITLRDWFAGQVLAGLAANPEAWRDALATDLAVTAYLHADAMMEARQG